MLSVLNRYASLFDKSIEIMSTSRDEHAKVKDLSDCGCTATISYEFTIDAFEHDSWAVFVSSMGILSRVN